MMRLAIETATAPPSDEIPTCEPSLKWEKCTNENKSAYGRRLSHLLSQSPGSITQCNVIHCPSQDCRASIQREYDEITCLITEADKVLPRHRPGVQKHWWTAELTLLRNQSIDIHRLWKLEGSPRSGATNDERLRVRANYRRAIKTAQRRPKQASWNKLHQTFVSKNTTEFWKSWKRLYNKNKSGLHSVVNGVTGKAEIAESFKGHFVKVLQPNNQQRVDQLNKEFQQAYSDAKESHSNCDCSSYSFTLQNILDATFRMKKGKTVDDHKINAEHFFDAPLTLFDRLQTLFNKMLTHGHVPQQFQSGAIIPIVKDRQGDLGDMHNYRGITIAPILSKIFEYALQTMFQPYLSTSNYQFGFKKKASTSHAIYCLRETIDYYTSHGRSVNCSFLDASKALDRLVHAGLFLKLLQRHVPIIFLDIIIAWYANLRCRVRCRDQSWSKTGRNFISCLLLFVRRRSCRHHLFPRHRMSS